MKKITFLIVGMLYLANGFGQQLITPMGNNIQNERGSISFSVGEIAVHTMKNTKEVVTQGFQQPNFITLELLNLEYANGIMLDANDENGVFSIKGIDEYPDNQLTILNRWGDVVYQAQPYQNDWNGYHNNQALPQATYYFIFYTDAARQQVVKGNIYLLQP